MLRAAKNELRRIDAYNKECSEAEAGLNLEVSELSCSKQVELIESRFHAADLLAIKAQSISKKILLAILIFAFVSAIGIHHLSKTPSVLLLVFCSLTVGVAYAVHFFGIRRNKNQTKHQDYRALAEAFRVQLNWAYAGIWERVHNYFLQNVNDDSSWIRTALKFCSAEFPVNNRLATRQEFEAVLKNWVIDQKQYFERAFKKQLEKNMALSSLKFSLLLVAGIFKLIPDIIDWLVSNSLNGSQLNTAQLSSEKALWFFAAQAFLAVSLITFHVKTRAKELKSQKKVLSLLNSGEAKFTKEPVGFWSRPSGLLTMVIIALTMGAALLYAVISSKIANTGKLADICELIFVISATTAAMIHIYGHVNAFADHLREYSRMLSLYAHAQKSLQTAIDSDRFIEALKIIQSLGKEALAEASSWLRLHRARPIEVPRV